jgi:HlyD family secretion protein
MAEDTTRLLRSLAIDRGTAERASAPARGRRGGGVLAGVLGTLVVMALAGAGAWWWLGAPALLPRDKPAVVAAPVESDSPPKAPAAVPAPRRTGGLVASGYVVARRKATVAAEITGKVTEVYVDEGMTVTAGQVIAKLDSVLAEADLALARSRAAAAEAAAEMVVSDLDEAERVLGRAQSLSKNSYVSAADLTKAEARTGVLRAQLTKVRAELATARLDATRAASVVEKHAIKAPFSGVVVDRSAQPGEMISPMSAGGGFTRTGICTVVDMDSLEIEVDVNEAYIGRVSAGQNVDAVLDAFPDWTIPASVLAIVPTANREKATVKVRITFKDRDPRILPDMASKVTFLDSGSAATDAAGPRAMAQ